MADRITELEAENARLSAELEKAAKQEASALESGKVMLYMLQDVEEAEESHENARKEWESTFDAITDPLFIHDREFRVVRANRAYLTASGEANFKEIIERPYFEVFPKMDGPFRMCLKAHELREKEEEEEEEFSCALTNRIFKVRFYPIKDTEGKYLYSVHILEDITDAKKAEERTKEEMEITRNLLMIADATAHTTDIDKLMEQVVHCAKEIIVCDILLSYLWDSSEKVFKPSHQIGLPHNLIPLFRTEPLKEKSEFVKKAMDGKVIIIEDERLRSLEDKRKNSTSQFHNLSTSAFSWLPDINTIAVIPLISKTDSLGLIIGVYKTSIEFTERDKKIMDGISYQVSTALEQARLYKETVNKSMELFHKIETIQVMHEIDKNILSTLDRQEIIETTVRMIARLIPCDRAGIGLVDREKGGIIYTAGFGVDSLKKGAFTLFKDTSNTEVVETGRPQYIPDFGEIKDILPIEKMLFENSFRSHIGVPLVIKGEVAGILNIGAKRPSAFTPEDSPPSVK